MIFGQNLTMYTVLYKESESEVKNMEILQPGGAKLRKTNVKLIILFFCLLCFKFEHRVMGTTSKANVSLAS